MIKVIRISFDELSSRAYLEPESSALLISPSFSSSQSPQIDTELSVVYYRAGYSPSDYTSPKHWEARRLVEYSMAIKCPSIALQLAGAKKVQQVLAQDGVLERFLPSRSSDEIARVRQTFAGLWPLEASTSIGRQAFGMALTEPERYVVKPCREGGGNNIYRTSIPAFLNNLKSQEERAAYILMELIEPPPIQNMLVKAGTASAKKGEVVSELGIYGVCAFKTSSSPSSSSANQKIQGSEIEILLNRNAGHLLRTKGRESDEGGVAVGFAVIDAPLLIE